MCEKYNGWSNYPTGCVKLWIDNDEGLQQEVKDMAQSYIIDAEADDYFTKKENATTDFYPGLRDFVDECMNLDGSISGVSLDLLSWAFDEVDWYELAKAIIEDEIEGDSE
jgi:hypothetical protein